MKVSTYIQEPIEERKGIPDSFLEIEVRAPQTHGKLKFTWFSYPQIN